MSLTDSNLGRLARAVCAALLLFGLVQTSQAADFGGDCCADLEERLAELEATTARKGNRKVSLTIYGHVNEAVLFWDDGFESNAYVVDGQNDQSNFGFLGEASISPDLTAGYSILVRLQNALSGEVSQDDDDGGLIDLRLWESNLFIESKTWGRLTLGQAARASDGAPEQDLSETGLAAYAGVQDIGGGLSLRRSSDGAQVGVGWGDIYSHFNGDTGNLIRYDTPTIVGFTVSATWGEDDIWDIGAAYEGKLADISIAAAIAYTDSTDQGFLDGPSEEGVADFSTIVGSIAIVHEPSGLNALVAAGQTSFDDAVTDADGMTRNVENASFIYTKLGWIAHLNSFGHTAFFGEYGYFKDFVSAGSDAGLVAELDGSGGAGVRITGNDATVWGAGVVQHIDAAEMDMYIGYRYHEADFDLVDVAGNGVTTTDLEEFHTVIVGSNISF